MGEVKPFASLSSGLLARKGQAKPAMRPQGFGSFGGASPQDDLGWNDMGYAAPQPIAPSPAPPETSVTVVVQAPQPVAPVAEPIVAAPPPVVVQQADLEQELAAALNRTVDKAPAKRTEGAKAAFTLRLDAERHLRLRLACAVGNRSAQKVVTEALDAFLDTLPGLDALADQARGDASTR